MALPTSAVQSLGFRARSGIILGIGPSTGGPYRVEIQRSTQSASSASSLWQSFIVDPTSGGYTFTDYLPLSTRTFYYKMRHFGLGSSNSSWSATINAKPAKLPEVFQAVRSQRNNKGNTEFIGGDIWLSSAKTAKVGTQVTTGTVTKTIRINYAEFVPDSANSKWQYTDSDGLANSGTSALIMRAPLLLPPNVQLVNFRARMYRRTTAAPSTAKALLLQVTDGPDTTASATAATIKTLTHVTKGYKTISTGTTITIDPTKSYNIDVVLKSTVAAGARVLWVELDYKMQTYIRAI